MRVLAFAVAAVVACISASSIWADEKKAPEKIVFQAKNGNVTFDHKKHTDAVKGDCKTCHPKLFQESKTAPLNFKPNMHKTAEAAKTSCTACHLEGGTAFAIKGNCGKCHVKSAT